MKRIYLFLLFILSNLLSFGQNIDSLIEAVVAKAEILRKKDKNYNAAISLLHKSLMSFQEIKKEDKIHLAPLYHKIGVNYYMKGDMNNALKFNSLALDIRQKKYGKKHIDVIRGYFNRGSMYRKIQDYEKAKVDLKLAIVLMENLINSNQSKDTSRLIKMYNEYYRTNILLKDNNNALNYWNKSYQYYSRNKKIYKYNIAELFDLKGFIYQNKKNNHLAIEYFNRALRLYSNVIKQNCQVEIARVLHNLAISQEDLKQYVFAKENYHKAIKIYEENLLKGDDRFIQQEIGNCYTDLIKIFSKTEEYNHGKEYFKKGLDFTLEGWGTSHHPRIAELYRNRAKISIAQKLYAEALEFNQKAFHALLPEFKTDDPFVSVNLEEHAVKNKHALLETLAQKAKIFTVIFNEGNSKGQKYLVAAFQNYQTLDTLITQIRQSYEAQGSQFELIRQCYPIYEKAIRAALTLFEKTKEKKYLTSAYHFAAKNKAMVLLGGMQDEEAKAFSSIPQALRDEEKMLKRSIYQLESQIYRQADQEADPVLKDSLFSLRRNYQKLIDRFEQEYADYYDLKYRFDKTISVSALQQQLSPGSCIMEYFVGDDEIFVFIITKTGFDYSVLEKPAKFEQYCFAFREQIESQAGIESIIDESYQLFDWLLKKPLNLAKQRGEIKHLVIIPDGSLLQLSFDVLVQDKAKGVPDYLIKDYAISYAYSNQLLFDYSEKRKAKFTFAGFGLEYDDYTLADLETYVDNPLASLPLSRALGHLEFSDDEIMEIADLLGGDKWINDTATRQAFLENADRYAILHLATHGIVNENYPMNSALIFTRQNDSTEYFLRAADLYGMELNADMAVLSACNTGAGIIERGEGVRSLARAFSSAGCPSLVATLWNASDKSTKDILVDFYKNLKKGMTKNEAMRQAKLTYLASASPTYQSPYYWSHLNVIGESGTLEVLEIPFWRRYWWVWTGLGLGLIGLLDYRMGSRIFRLKRS